jgi:hypothetical protein
MEFREATEGMPADRVARALGVSRQTVWQYRMDPTATGHRNPPAGWEPRIAALAMELGDRYHDVARALAEAE